MGSAKAKGAGAGAVTGAAAGSTFGPVGTVVGGVAGGAIGYFGTEEPPEYQQPALDPAYALLMEQQKKQQIEATQGRLTRDTSLLNARYGMPSGNATTPPLESLASSADPTSLLTRYATQLAFANRAG